MGPTLKSDIRLLKGHFIFQPSMLRGYFFGFQGLSWFKQPEQQNKDFKH